MHLKQTIKMNSEFVNAAHLFILLNLLFWSLTWNSSSKMEYKGMEHKTQIASKHLNLAKQDKLRLTYQHYYFIKYLGAVQNVSERSSAVTLETNTVLPTFNEWKEMEKKKQDSGSMNKDISSNRETSSRRKLNFSSSKCGAKILTSNPEAKHRTAILNEKADEYMLNPCNVRTWFVIELCDTVKATQIEMANYELYSSSPRQFYVFWSDVYPTSLWHFLGNFEAKDRRVMQTFDLNVKNLGKFIKVVIYSHHGKEHYCPLSVVRVLGYSMVQDFEDKESATNILEAKETYNSSVHEDKVLVSIKPSLERLRPENRSFFHTEIHSTNFVPNSICSLLVYCNSLYLKNTGLPDKICIYRPVCRFLNIVIIDVGTLCKSNLSNKLLPVDKLVADNGEMQKNVYLLTNVSENDQFNDSLTKKTSNLPQFKRITNLYGNNSSSISKKSYNSSNVSDKAYFIKSSKEYSSKYKNNGNFTNTTIPEKSVAYRDNTKVHMDENLRKECACNNNEIESPLHRKKDLDDKETELESTGTENSVDSAGLIQKESVLIRLKSRIKSSEIELNLINKYLQQLSQSYRHQMESMQGLFNQTVKAINIASEKSSLIDNKQEESISALEVKVNSLKWKIEHLANGQKDLIIQVVELHGFFLVLEIIIISTIFTIFLNVFRRQNMISRTRSQHFWKMAA